VGHVRSSERALADELRHQLAAGRELPLASPLRGRRGVSAPPHRDEGRRGSARRQACLPSFEADRLRCSARAARPRHRWRSSARCRSPRVPSSWAGSKLGRNLEQRAASQKPVPSPQRCARRGRGVTLSGAPSSHRAPGLPRRPRAAGSHRSPSSPAKNAVSTSSAGGFATWCSNPASAASLWSSGEA
jgi:hypothetical protein